MSNTDKIYPKFNVLKKVTHALKQDIKQLQINRITVNSNVFTKDIIEAGKQAMLNQIEITRQELETEIEDLSINAIRAKKEEAIRNMDVSYLIKITNPLDNIPFSEKAQKQLKEAGFYLVNDLIQFKTLNDFLVKNSNLSEKVLDEVIEFLDQNDLNFQDEKTPQKQLPKLFKVSWSTKSKIKVVRYLVGSSFAQIEKEYPTADKIEIVSEHLTILSTN
ncbi:hypothetical protein [Bizionia myxarmorum]|uniref:Uncharacterized protein n=1 Tax=Bizionia myxarmorum TaxID=291186 RepID=A0A5D0R9I7_9FLAO|nr:hypothetical protein [Bizionia myxarmorum]TYB78310.1 hypothetical protein ES674_00590 [Bizionia myxarmorum]